MKYRSRTEIASQILEAANGVTTKTKIMYKAFLSYNQLREYLSLLIQNHLVVNDTPGIYKTTTKGLNLDVTRKMDELLQITDTEERAGQTILISEK